MWLRFALIALYSARNVAIRQGLLFSKPFLIPGQVIARFSYALPLIAKRARWGFARAGLATRLLARALKNIGKLPDTIMMKKAYFCISLLLMSAFLGLTMAVDTQAVIDPYSLSNEHIVTCASLKFSGKDLPSHIFKDFMSPFYRAKGFQFLHPLEEQVVREYTMGNEWNSKLWDGNLSNLEILRTKLLCSALNKLPNYEGVVFRGAEIPEEMISHIKPGSIYVHRSFLSASPLFWQAERFAKNVRYVIYSKTGKDIQELSTNPMEREVLFGFGAEFYVHKIVTGQLGSRVIYLEEVKRIVQTVTASNLEEAKEKMYKLPHGFHDELHADCQLIGSGKFKCQLYSPSYFTHYLP